MKAWEDLLCSLEKHLGVEAVAKWLRSIKVTQFDAANLYLEATPFQRTWFDEHVAPLITGIFRNNNHRPIRIHWELERKTKTNEQSPPPFRILSDRLDPSYKLESLLPFQPMAIELSRELILSGKTGFNPLFFFGGTGSGKSHLLMSIAAGLIEKGKDAFYVQAETFTEHVVQAIRLGFMQDLRKRYRSVDVLLIDDIHIFSRKNATQEEFFHTFNALHSSGKQIVISSYLAPYQLEEIEQRLVSRFEWGIAVPLPPPNQDQVRSILESKMRLLELSLPEEVILFLLNRFRSSPKAPVEALHFLALRLSGSPTKTLSLPQAERILSERLARERAREVTPEKIMKETATYFGIRIEDLTGKSQMRSNVEPRKIALFLCRSLLKMPFQKIGFLFNRDHSTVMTSIESVETALLNKAPPFYDAVERISKALTRPS